MVCKVDKHIIIWSTGEREEEEEEEDEEEEEEEEEEELIMKMENKSGRKSGHLWIVFPLPVPFMFFPVKILRKF